MIFLQHYKIGRSEEVATHVIFALGVEVIRENEFMLCRFLIRHYGRYCDRHRKLGI